MSVKGFKAYDGNGEEYLEKYDYNSLDNVPTKVSQFENDNGYATTEQVEDKVEERLPKSGGTISGNIAFNGQIFLSSESYGDALPSPGNKGRLFLKKV